MKVNFLDTFTTANTTQVINTSMHGAVKVKENKRQEHTYSF